MIFITFLLLGCCCIAISGDISASYTCDFESDDCGIVNEPGHVASWQRKKMNIGGRDGYVMSLESSGQDAQSGKAVSPDFELDLTMPGCLTFDLYISGYGKLFVESVDALGSNIIKTINGDTNGWKSYSVGVNIVHDVKFLIEGRINPTAGSRVMALDNFVFELNSC